MSALPISIPAPLLPSVPTRPQLHVVPPVAAHRAAAAASTALLFPGHVQPAVAAPVEQRHPLAPHSKAQAVRRRATVLIVIVSLLALAAVSLSARLSAPAQPVPVSSITVVVQPGDTLWEIATEHAPAGASTSAYMQALIEANGLEGGSLQAWQVLRLPAGA